MITVTSVTPHKAFVASPHLQAVRGLEQPYEVTYIVEAYEIFDGIASPNLLTYNGDYYRPFSAYKNKTEEGNPHDVDIEFEDGSIQTYCNVTHLQQVPKGNSFEEGALIIGMVSGKKLRLDKVKKWRDQYTEGTQTRKYLCLKCVKLTPKEKARVDANICTVDISKVIV